jgi:hypothetical protein
VHARLRRLYGLSDGCYGGDEGGDELVMKLVTMIQLLCRARMKLVVDGDFTTKFVSPPMIDKKQRDC